MLFGHQNDDVNQSPQTSPVVDNTTLNPLAVDPATGASLPVASSGLQSTLDQPIDAEQPVLNQPVASEDIAATPTLSSPSPFSTPEPVITEPDSSNENVATNEPSPVNAAIVEPSATSSTPIIVPAGGDDLLHLKQQALEQLSPLVSQLDQTPEEKFRTTMMMIQSTDNQALIKDAYDAAQQITDEKARAQALLDVVNEINYFTQQKNS